MSFLLNDRSFHGKALRMMEFAGLRLTDVIYSPNLRNPRHAHKYAYIGITLRGHSTQQCENQVRSSRPWTVMFHPAGEVHSDQFHESGAHEFNIELAPERLENLRQCSLRVDAPMNLNGGKAGWVAARLYREMRFMDDLSRVAIDGLTIELMAEILRQNPNVRAAHPPLWLQRADELIHDRFTERLTLSEIAEAVDIHPVHLAREFHRRMGSTIGQTLRQLRVDMARRLLLESDRSLADIALATGFCDQSQFSKTFKIVAGLLPTQYRQLNSCR